MTPGQAPSQLIDARIRDLGDWRGEILAQVRVLIHAADPQVEETWKWRGVPVWEHDGILCTGETYKSAVKLTFAKGAALPDPAGLFNASLDGNARRAIDLTQGASLDEEAFRSLIRAAVALNTAAATKKSDKAPPKAGKDGVVLLSGGNPRIPKGDGDGPVQAYIAAMPGWKSELGRRLDSLIVEAVPGVRKAVKWNSPFYGVGGQGWFLNIHVLTRYVKVTFFKGVALDPPPPGATPRSGDSRWIDIYEDDALDQPRLTDWVKQAAAIPGWTP